MGINDWCYLILSVSGYTKSEKSPSSRLHHCQWVKRSSLVKKLLVPKESVISQLLNDVQQWKCRSPGKESWSYITTMHRWFWCTGDFSSGTVIGMFDRFLFYLQYVCINTYMYITGLIDLRLPREHFFCSLWKKIWLRLLSFVR